MEEKRITQKQLKKVQVINLEVHVAVISILLSMMFWNSLFQKISTYPGFEPEREVATFSRFSDNLSLKI